MEIFYNELSREPIAADKEEAKHKIIKLLKTMEVLREKNINIMRTNDRFYAEMIAPDYSFSDFYNDPLVSMTLKILLRSITANPYICDENSYEAEIFVMNDFSIENHLQQQVHSEGLASAHIFNSPVISLSGHVHWEKDSLQLKITSSDGEKVKWADIPNIYSTTSISSNVFTAWFNSLAQGIQLNSEANIYKLFPENQFHFENQAVEDIVSWYYDDSRFLLRVKELINDILLNPFSGGKGKTEVLKGMSGKASKHIIKKDVIVYTYTKEKITIHQCRGHYKDK
ncbi:MAG: type II toxin-antitoxin system YoeB family toxin [Dysgonamonadaceae bacterium]|jgi:toxin YoeB|nr:type II toxin-antitoxin system YoeB family toxin [Dysgonamonadaceae bacterium]